MIVEFSIRPVRHPSGEADVTEKIETVERGEAGSRPRSMNASIEGSWDQVMSVIRGCHQAHAGDHPRVVTTIVVVDDNLNGHSPAWPRFLQEAVLPADVQVGHPSRPVRRIPVDIH
ncbi:MAG: thiamine-binding protein [Deltaproteobacteria bacterium]